MSAADRHPALRKAPAVDDLTALTSPAGRPGGPSYDLASRRPGPGRPRGRRRMEPFSSKIEISLRDDLDRYLAIHDISIVDFLDEAIRDRLNRNLS
ncbi:hypothetical protein PlfCFBP13513_15260 [Plantibacter flavus]|nr:hypothetical protein [Plantibacter sp. CFBP 8775]MBD8467308.1 hypothetical protein [Plantibacter sp. CFBP 8798]TKJ96778.1 hypothetical protein PlfCFBP13513_15260 [Plantibacter flavus]